MLRRRTVLVVAIFNRVVASVTNSATVRRSAGNAVEVLSLPARKREHAALSAVSSRSFSHSAGSSHVTLTYVIRAGMRVHKSTVWSNANRKLLSLTPLIIGNG